MSLFSRKRKVVINYVDLDEDKKIITSSGELIGKAGEAVDYSSADELKKLVAQGYKLDYNEYDPTGSAPAFSDEPSYTYTISLKHDTEKLDHADDTVGVTKDDLEKVGKQVVHYKGAAIRTPQDNVSYVTFKRSVVIDKITKKIVGSLNWNPEKQTYMMIATPEIPGYITADTVVGGETVTPDDCDREYTVEYEINQQPSTNEQKLQVEYVDHDAENQEIITDTLTGQANMMVDYDPEKTIEKLEEQGYALVDNGYNPVGEVQFYSSNDDYVPVFIITMKHTIGPVDADHINDKVDREKYLKEVSFSVNYEGAGSATPDNNVQKARWTRSLTIDQVTGQIMPDGQYTTDWQVNREIYDDVVVPVVNGYHADEKLISGGKVTKDNIVKKVTYTANGRIIPVDTDGKKIAGAANPVFETDPTDPTQVLEQQVLPEVEGYNCDIKTTAPYNPAKDLEVTYKPKKDADTLVITVGSKKKTAKKEEIKKEETAKPAISKKKEEPKQSAPESVQAASEIKQAVSQLKPKQQAHDQVAIINFIDMDHNGEQLTSSGPLTGKPGESINDLYSTEIPLKAIAQTGYHVVFNSFDGKAQKFGNNDLMPQVFTIGLSKAGSEKAESSEKQTDADLNTVREASANNKDTAAMALGIAATIISLIGLIGKENK